MLICFFNEPITFVHTFFNASFGVVSSTAALSYALLSKNILDFFKAVTY